MTEIKKKRGKKVFVRALSLAASLFTLVFMLFYADLAIKHARGALFVIANTLIPSLFPFMVISDVLQRVGFVSLVGRLFSGPMRRLFGISGAGAGVMLLGMLCGFPIGAKCAVALYDAGEISSVECERLIALSGIPSAAFCVGTVGASLFGDVRVGAGLYAICVLSALTVGAIDSRLAKKSPRIRSKKAGYRTDFGINELTEAVSSSAVGVIKISGFVLFFSVLLGVMSELPFIRKLGEEAVGILFSVFELTSGVAKAAAVSDGTRALTIAAFALGWSSLSIHFQIMSVASGRGLGFSRYFLLKLAVGALSAALAFAWATLCPISINKSSGALLASGMPSQLSAVILGVFCLSLIIAIAKKAKSW